MSEASKTKYFEMLKNPETKRLKFLYSMLAEIPDHMFPRVLVYGSNFFESNGLLHREIVKSEKLLELTCKCFAIIRARQNLF